LRRVEVRHQRRYVLRRSQPRVDVVSRVEEAARRDGDVVDGVAVEREFEVELDCGGTAITLRQHFVFLWDCIKLHLRTGINIFIPYLYTRLVLSYNAFRGFGQA